MRRVRRVATYLALAFYTFALGCSSVREVPLNDSLDSPGRVIAVIYPSGKVVEFNEDGGIINTYRGTIDGVTVRGDVVSIPLDDTLRVRMLRTDTPKTVVLTGVVICAVVAVIAIILHNANLAF